MHVRMRASSRASNPRRLIAVGVVRRRDGRTLTFTATQAGVTGRIIRAGVAR
ncbi:hypothetical protein [Streptomyces sp. NBC_01803]|uniref:hypothetical protein n=1 Tax=Streptomyces sp. NBC_01803 TaxID=2975946 RepID=UPI002DDA7755|nr:hypothetical protein [Streptomyces sp. NBC_01803]WSA44963.1 hypothetical protein OIE51_12535 [Streptomyces sp. NBC_01803]